MLGAAKIFKSAWSQNHANLKVCEINHSYADIWVASEDEPHADYHYGGTRLLRNDQSNEVVETLLKELAWYESGVKNRLINRAFREGVLNGLEDRIPKGLANSRVFGGRCVFRPKSAELNKILADPTHVDFPNVLDSIFAKLGKFLNDQGGRIKLTPDFGRFAHLADALMVHTPHSLGIKCESGGCGGKSSYTTTGIIEAYLHKLQGTSESKVTLIGSSGALGTDVLEFLMTVNNREDICISDIALDQENSKNQKGLLEAQFGKFTNACLQRGGVIIATTVGEELINSDWKQMPKGTIFLAAHNMAIPNSGDGIQLTRDLNEHGVSLVPGPILTLGGALTSRVEWFWRKNNENVPFDKSLAHEVVKRVTSFYMKRIDSLTNERGFTPYQAMFDQAFL